jgi:predicted transcriptional regulator YheO
MKKLSEAEIDKFRNLVENNSVNEVASILSVSRRTVYKYMAEYGIEPETSKLKLALKKLSK